MKRPAFQFYPADWRKDTALQLCSVASRGMWWEMLCVMHEGQPYGHLAQNGVGLSVGEIANLCHVPMPAARKAIGELEARKVFSRTDEGVIFSRRMVRDERARKAWRERQERHRQEDRDDERDTPRDVTPDVTAMSPRSSASAVLHLRDDSEPVEGSAARGRSPPAPKHVNGKEAKRPTRLPDDWRLPDEWRDWAVKVYRLEPQRVVRMSLTFADHFQQKPGKDATSLDWRKRWQNWVRKDMGDA